MPIELRVPEVGESITEVLIGDWLKQVGDLLERDDPVVVIETDKVTVELLAPARGYLSQMVLPKGSAAKVRDFGRVDGSGNHRCQCRAGKTKNVRARFQRTQQRYRVATLSRYVTHGECHSQHAPTCCHGGHARRRFAAKRTA